MGRLALRVPRAGAADTRAITAARGRRPRLTRGKGRMQLLFKIHFHFLHSRAQPFERAAQMTLHGGDRHCQHVGDLHGIEVLLESHSHRTVRASGASSSSSSRRRAPTRGSASCSAARGSDAAGKAAIDTSLGLRPTHRSDRCSDARWRAAASASGAPRWRSAPVAPCSCRKTSCSSSSASVRCPVKRSATLNTRAWCASIRSRKAARSPRRAPVEAVFPPRRAPEAGPLLLAWRLVRPRDPIRRERGRRTHTGKEIYVRGRAPRGNSGRWAARSRSCRSGSPAATFSSLLRTRGRRDACPAPRR